MSPSTSQAREPAVLDPATQSAVPRKRRRRAPVTGATEDCFTCRKRHTKCDRRRPYCSQCIDLGKECSGYRTTLTWGVGVASRGKLRGLSLPIPKSPATARTSNTSASGSQSAVDTNPAASLGGGGGGAGSSSSSSSSARRTNSLTSLPEAPTSAPNVRGPSPPRSAAAVGISTPADYARFEPSSPIPIPNPALSHLGWHVPGFGEHAEGFASRSGKLDRAPFHSGHLHKLHTSLGSAYGLTSSYDDAGLSSTGSMSAYSDSDYASPVDFPQTPDEFVFSDPGFPPYNNLFVDPPQTPLIPRSYPSGHDDMSSSLSSDHSKHEYLDAAGLHHGHHYGPPQYADAIYEGGVEPTTPCSPPQQRPYQHYHHMEMLLAQSAAPDSPVLAADAPSTALAMPPRMVPAPSYAMSPRMQYLLDYYDKAICPVLVAFDGPTNPYRMHVLPLAIWDEGLQNAIAALATNNIRMRGGTEAKRLGWNDGSLALPEHAYSRVTTTELREMQGEPTAEELRYKSTSIQMLNAQLADPTRAKSDSVLATLLVLCLFHVCDSGFTKFKTQLAGVQKLLSLRDRTVQSNFIGWIEMFFTWFDVMTSCVNDRELEMRGDSFDMMNLSANMGALEHLAGCEGRLFKLIARLGRLNLLSQNRPVRDRLDQTTPRSSPQHKRARDYYSLSYDNLDGNGWGTPVHEMPLSPFGSSPFMSPTLEDPRQEFWIEWHDIRTRLQEWELEVVPASASNPSLPAVCSTNLAALDPSQRELLHISESFRYSALLYVERLAHPKIPSSALNLQNLVAQSLYHISHIGVNSCVNKFLLWPLFITGTECVDENHRAIIRQRCMEIQRESGFFNNLSGLEVLEKVWREGEDGSMKQDAAAQMMDGQAFKWRRAMDRVDGEYVIV